MMHVSHNISQHLQDRAEDTLRPVTIKQLLDAQHESGDDFKIDGNKATQVWMSRVLGKESRLTDQLTFVGQIRNIATQTTNITYKLDDGTGTIEVKQWNDADALEASPLKSKLVEGSYCRAWGKLKSFHERRHVNASIIRPVENMNEVSYHMLEATSVHLYFTRGPVGGSNNSGGAAGTNQGQQQADGGSLGAADLQGYSAMAKRIFKFLKESPQGLEGLHVQDVASQLSLDSGETARALDDLLNGGVVYTTVDDQTFAPLEE